MEKETFVQSWKEKKDMKNNLRDILPLIANEQEQEEILSYLDGRMAETEREQFEKKITADPFLKDALEGLTRMSRSEINSMRADLRKNLSKKISKRRRTLKSIGPDIWIYATLILVLLLIIAGYLVISRFR